MTPEQEWKARIAALAPGDVASVITTTERDEESTTFEVTVSLRSLAKGAFEMGEDQMRVWEHEVTYREAVETSGLAFMLASQEQNRVAQEVWLMSRTR